VRKDDLLETLRRSFEGDAWHGPAVLDTLAEVTSKDAQSRPPNGAHSIWEITLHIAAWANEVTARLEGKTPGEPAEGDYPKPSGDWEEAVARVREARTKLCQVVAELSEEDLEKRIGTVHDAALATGFTYAATIQGLAQHNAYHAGQIRMLLKISGALG
jgi:uncharacterized damage-inducible protein DinB